jgi:uncharacterized protein YgbK (DUF1537 family)
MTRLLAFYGDDFTGSTDVMEALASHGVETVLFARMPTAEEFVPYRNHAAIGLAGTSRSETPAWMDANLPSIFRWMKGLDARFCHYKVCSTFDSAPHLGSIGRAIDIAAGIFDQAIVPLVVGAPQLKRYTFAGHLFAAYQGEIYRIDRHPVMSRHPVTPMAESDLRRHLALQTSRPVQLWNGPAVEPGIRLIDVHDAETQAAAGRILCRLEAGARPFLCGSSGVEYALLKALAAAGEVSGAAAFAPVPAVDRMLVVSGSVSPTTERQIRYALAHGFTGVSVDPLCLLGAAAEAAIAAACVEAEGILEAGGSPLIYTALGPATDAGERLKGGRNAIGQALGRIARQAMERHSLPRIIVAGGDSSSHALSELDVLALTTRFPLAATPGSPLCTAKATSGRTFEMALKGGQVGHDDYFAALKNGIN